MRNYLYISDAKVDSYLPQFSRAEKKRIAARLGVNVGVFQASVEGELLAPTNRVHRLEAVEAKLRKEDLVGARDSGAPWIEGTVDATAATFPENEDVMFFFSNEPAQFLGLAGSAHHVIGNLRSETAIAGQSHLHSLLKTLESAVKNYAFVVQKDDDALLHFMQAGVAVRPGRSSWTDVMISISDQFEGTPTQSLTFLARRLIPDSIESDARRYTLATPLYLTVNDS